MKKTVITLLIGLMAVSAFAGQEHMYVRAEMNGWSGDEALTEMTIRPIDGGIFLYIIAAVSTDAESEFKFVNTLDWGTCSTWSRGEAFNVDTKEYWYEWSPNNSKVSVTMGKYYSFIFRNIDNPEAGIEENSEGYVFETSAIPVTISSVSQSPITTSVTPDDDVVVTVTASASPSVEENVFVRYTTDAWTSYSIVECSFTGTSGTATIPKQVHATPVQYYVFTTTIDEPNTAIDNIDLMTIHLKTLSSDPITNYSYNSIDPSTPITLTSFDACCHEGAVEITWETESETNNASFIIYRDNVSIGSVAGAGTSSETHNYTFTDTNVIPGNTYTYVLADMTLANEETRFTDDAVTVTVVGTSLDVVANYSIGSAYPNPFNPTTVIPITLSAAAHVTATVYDLTGKEIATLHNGDLSAGSHSLSIDGNNMVTGIYLVHIAVDNKVNVQKIALMK